MCVISATITLCCIKKKLLQSTATAHVSSALNEYPLHQEHIADRPAGDGDEHLPPPEVQCDRHGHGDELGHAMRAREEGVGFCSVKIRNGRKRVSIVPSMQRAIVTICCVSVMPIHLLSSCHFSPSNAARSAGATP